jgi:hypothetical protein
MIKIAGIKSNDKINFKEFVDFFYKADWEQVAVIFTLSLDINVTSLQGIRKSDKP